MTTDNVKELNILINGIVERIITDDLYALIESHRGHPANGVADMMVLTERLCLAVREILAEVYQVPRPVADQLMQVMVERVVSRKNVIPTNEGGTA